jgi:hypothetical protein
MSFADEVGMSGGKPILKFNKEACYVKRGSEEAMNDQEFVAMIREARAGYIKFNANEEPERRLGAIFPKDEAPSRSSLGDTDRSLWPKGKFGKEQEDPWTAVIEIPLQHRETGEEYLFAAQSKMSIAAAMDFLSQAKRVPEGFDPVIRLGVGSFKSRFGPMKKPVLSIVGKVSSDAPAGSGKDKPFNDALDF